MGDVKLKDLNSTRLEPLSSHSPMHKGHEPHDKGGKGKGAGIRRRVCRSFSDVYVLLESSSPKRVDVMRARKDMTPLAPKRIWR